MPIPPEDHEGRTFLSDDVRDRIRDAIISGALQPGETLSESGLMRQFQVSRTTLRRALSDLTTYGLVENTPNRSPRVVAPSHADVAHAFTTLGILMDGVVRFSVPVLTRAERQRQLDGIDATIASIAVADVDALKQDAVHGYHRWADACPNPFLAAALHHRADALSNTIVQHDSTPHQSVVIGALHLLRLGVHDGDPTIAAQAIRVMHQSPIVQNTALRNLRAADAARWSWRPSSSAPDPTREG